MPSSREGGPTLAEAPVVRVAGLPVSALNAMRCVDTWSAVRDALALRRWLDIEGSTLADELYPLIGAPRMAGAPAKPLLVALRRSLFNIRQPGDRVWCAQVRDALPPQLGVRIARWIATLNRHEHTLRGLPDRLATERARMYQVLRRCVAEDVFRHGLVQGSPELSRELDTWLSAPLTREPDRPTALRLAKYLARVVAKTSPYATFTLTGAGRWRDDGPAVAHTGRWSWHSAIEPNVWLVRQLTRAMAQGSELEDTLTVQVNPSLIEDRGVLRWLEGGWGARALSLPAGEAVRLCLDHLRQEGERTLAELRDYLTARGGGEKSGRYLSRLIELGVLETRLPLRDQSLDHLGDLATWLKTAPDGVGDSVPAALETLRATLEDYPHIRVPGHRRLRHQRVEQTFDDLLRPHSTGSQGTALTPRKNLFHENAVLREPVLALNRAAWRECCEDLDTVRRLLTVFQPDLAAKAVAAQVFADRIGPDQALPFTRFYGELLALVSSATPDQPDIVELGALLRLGGERETPAGESAVPDVRHLDQLRRQVHDLLTHAAVDARGVVQVLPADVRRMLRGWPEHLRPAQSLSCYVQRIDPPDRDDVHLVLNGVGVGYGQSRSRLDRLLARVGEPLPERTPYSHPRVLLAESGGVFGSNLNLRRAAVPWEIDYPGVSSDRPAGARVPLAELYVRHVPEQRRLRLTRGPAGPEVRPLHLGTLTDALLPPALRTLVQLFGETPNPASPTWTVFAQLPHQAPERVRSGRRIAMGRVTVSRATWSVRVGALPHRHKGESDAGYLLRTASWFAAHGVPERCFLRVLSPNPPERDTLRSLTRKPMYLDLGNWFLVSLLEREVRNRADDDLMVFQEALPDFQAAPAYGRWGHRVTEYIVELNAPQVRHG